MKNYTYTGTNINAFTLNDGKEFILIKDKQYELPSDNKHIQTLIALGLLVEVETKEIKTKK